MHYEVAIQSKDGPLWIEDDLLPGFIPQHVLDLMVDQVVESLGLCHDCPVAEHCHVLVPVSPESDTYTKLCPVLFHDAIKPGSWTVEDLV